MESIYYVLCWHCHRRCKHCYESRFRPYIRDELEAVVAEAQTNFPNIIANLPERMTFIEAKADDYVEKTGKIILSGGLCPFSKVWIFTITLSPISILASTVADPI